MTTLTTPRLAIPYPDGSERVMDGDNAMAAIAAKLDSLAQVGIPFRLQASNGAETFNFGGGAGPVSLSISFAASRFTVAPNVYTALYMGSYSGAKTPRIYASSVTPSGMTLNCYLEGGAFTGTIGGYWLALQMLPGAAGG